MNTSFERLVRFRAKDGRTLYGEAGSVWEKGLRGQVVKIFNGSDPFHDGFKLAGEEAEIAEVLSPSHAWTATLIDCRFCVLWLLFLSILESD